LRSENVRAVVFGGDGDLGYGPLWSGVVTARVMVRRGDLEAAAVLVADLFPEAV
jgi:hypothetical protein